MNIPIEIVKQQIRAGAVLYIRNGNMASKEPHYCVVLNTNPENDSEIIVVASTTKTDKRIRAAQLNGWSPSTIVTVTPNDCKFLTEDSAFDCNSPIAYRIEELLRKANINEWDLSKGSAVSPQVLKKLRSEMIKSNNVSQQIKEYIS